MYEHTRDSCRHTVSVGGRLLRPAVVSEAGAWVEQRVVGVRQPAGRRLQRVHGPSTTDRYRVVLGDTHHTVDHQRAGDRRPGRHGVRRVPV